MRINDLKPQHNNMNKGNKYGNELIRHSIKSLGFGRSIVVDKNNIVITGDKILNTAIALGLTKIHVVDTTGDTLVVVRRLDVESGTKKALELSLVDNLSSYENLEWDADAVEKNMSDVLSFNPKDWGGDVCCVRDLDITELLNDDVKISSKTPREKVFAQPLQLSLFQEDDF